MINIFVDIIDYTQYAHDTYSDFVRNITRNNIY